MIDVKGVSERLGVSMTQARRLIETGKIKGVNVGCGKRSAWRVSEESLAEFQNPKPKEKPKPDRRRRNTRSPFYDPNPVFTKEMFQ